MEVSTSCPEPAMEGIDWSSDSIPKGPLRFSLWFVREFLANLNLGDKLLLLFFMIFLFVVAYELLLFERSIKRFDKKLKETKLMLREADEFLREEESTGLCDGKAFRFSRESHKKKLAELERVRRKVRRLLARTSVLLKEIKAEQRRMELQLASSEMKRRIQEFDRQNEG